MKTTHTLDEIRTKAHSINCELTEEGFSPREIEIVGYYLKRIAASYLSYFTHREYDRTLDPDISDEESKEEYTYLS